MAPVNKYILLKDNKHIQSPNVKDSEWLNPRLSYIRKFNHPLPSFCPECQGLLEHDEHGEVVCVECNLVVSGPIEYVGLERVNYPYRY